MAVNKPFSVVVTLLILLIVLPVFLFIPLAADTAAGEVTAEEFPDTSIGDRYVYSLEASAIADDLGWAFAEEYYEYFEDLETGDMVMTVLKSEKVDVGDVTYDCLKIHQTFSMSFVAVLDEDTDVDDDRLYIVYSIDAYSWSVEENGTTVLEEGTVSFTSDYDVDGDHTKYEYELISIKEYTETKDSFSFPVLVSSSWTKTTSYRENTTSKSRTNDDDWDISYEDEEGSEVKEYEVESVNTVSVPAGRFKCFKVKMTESGDNDEEYQYFDVKNGFLVKYTIYEEGELMMAAELEEYRFANEISGGKDDDDDFEIFDMDGYVVIGLLSILALAAVAGVVIMRRKGEDSHDEPHTYGGKPHGMKPLKGVSRGRKAGAIRTGQPRPRRVCPTCRRQVRFIPLYRQHWCDSCQEYVKPRTIQPTPPSAVTRQQAPPPRPPVRPPPLSPDRCPACRKKGEYSEEYEDYYCWECEGYFDDLN